MNKTIFDKKMANSIHLKETIDGVAEKSINSNLRDYQIFGNTVQDGEPTVDNPVEVVSVGDSGRNFYEKIYSSWVTEANGATITFDDENQEIAIVDGASKWGSARLSTVLIAGKTYTFSATIKECNSSTGARLYVVGTAFNDGSQKWSDFGQVGDRLSLTFTVEKTLSRGTHLGLYPYGADKEYATATFSDISLVEGDPSKPYNIPIYVSGKNLFDKNEKVLPHPNWSGVSGSIDVSDNYISLTPVDTNVVNVRIFHCKVPVGEKITISASNIALHMNLAKANSTIMFAFSDNPFEQFGSGNFTETKANCSTLWYGSKNSNNPPTSIKHTTTVTKPYLVIAFTVQCGSGGLSGNFRIEDFQVELGSQQTAYEPYIGYQKTLHLTEPIRKIGEYQDYIDLRNQKLYRNVRELIVTGDENIQKITSGTSLPIYRFKIDNSQIANITSIWSDQKCNYYYGVDGALSKTETGVSVYYSTSLVGTHFRLRDTNFENADEVIAWLKEKYAEGKPLKMYYQSYDTIEEDIALSRLPQYKGQTIYQIATNIPSEFVGTYKTRL